MPVQRRRRLPTDFFDRLLSNQTDDQMNDLLTSLVDEQITPVVEKPEETPIRAARPAPAVPLRRTPRREKMDDAIQARDEELADESPGDTLIPRTRKMQAFPELAPLESVESKKPAGRETEPTPSGGLPPAKPAVSLEKSGAVQAPGPDRVFPELPGLSEVLPEPSAAPVASAPTEVRPPLPPAPAVPEIPWRQRAHMERVKTRWGKHERKPKLPKLAKPSAPVKVVLPKFSALDEYLDGKREKSSRRFDRLGRAAVYFLLPAFTAFSFFSWYPMLKGLVLSFFRYYPSGASVWLGAQNYARAFQDEMFWRTLLHAGGFCALVLALGFWLPVFLAIYIGELGRGKRLLRFLFFLPFLMPAVPASILWKWIMDQGFGILNSVIDWFPVADPHIGWLSNPRLALFSLVLVYIWKNTGWGILIYTAALGNIDETLYEEADIHGASFWQKIRHVTLPAIQGVLSVMFVITLMNTLQLFTEIYIMTQGGPLNSTEFIATYIYKQAFFHMDIGYASALSMVFLVMLLFITAFRLKRLDSGGA